MRQRTLSSIQLQASRFSKMPFQGPSQQFIAYPFSGLDAMASSEVCQVTITHLCRQVVWNHERTR
jgi:hypothetical protein